MIEQLELLRDLLEEAVTDADCEVGQVTITAGRPAAPSSTEAECVTRIYVFGATLLDLNQTNQDSCTVRSRQTMFYEIWSCYPEDWDDVPEADHETAAVCLYELMGRAWCKLVEAKDSDYFCECAFVELQPLVVQDRSGGAVSALGGVSLPYECLVLASP